MYTIGIVEDEVIEQEALQVIIKAYHPELSVAFVAGDSAQALACLRLCRPHILLLDVNLPGNNGLTLGKALRESGYAGLIIVNTAYAQFEYAQSAVQINAFDYLLKPCDPQRISQVLSRCVEKLRQADAVRDRQMNLNQLSDSYIFEHLLKGDLGLSAQLEHLGWPQDGCLQSLVMDLRLPGSARPQGRCLAGSTASEVLFLYEYALPGHLLVIAQPRFPLSPCRLRAAANLCALDLSGRLSFGGPCLISPLCPDAAKLSQALKALPDRAAPVQSSQTPALFLSPSPGQPLFRRFSALESKSLRLLRDRKLTRLHGLLWAALDEAPDNQGDVYALLLCSLMNALYLHNLSPLLPPMGQMLCVDQGYQQALESFLALLEEKLQVHGGESTMELALSIMQSEFMTPLSQSDVAKRLGMNPSYFSLQFKKRMGVNFVDRLTQIRMEHAKALIARDASVTLEQLAEQCGCTSKQYFCNVFRKYTGMTVSQYRARLPH